MSKKLDRSKKVEIVTSREESLREIAARYGLHHSTIDELFKESEEVLSRYWDEKAEKVGRPKHVKTGCDENTGLLKNELAATQKKAALTQMKLDYAELRLKWANERLESCEKKEKHLKKKRKKN